MNLFRHLAKLALEPKPPQKPKAENTKSKVHISCVVDDHPKFRMQAWNWLLSLAALKTQCRVFVHYLPGALSVRIQEEFASLGATLVEIVPFGDGAARYCNKIQQLESPDFLGADYIILSDADMVFLQDPALLVRPDHFRAKTVDVDNPPKALWSELFARAGLSVAAERIGSVTPETAPMAQTFATNFNGGLYVIPGSLTQILSPLWRKYAGFSLTQADLLGEFLHHSDQLAMGMALAKSELLIDRLPAGANLPTHLSKEALSGIPQQSVTAIHYHWHVDAHGLPLPVGIDWIDEAIGRVRGNLVGERRKRFTNEIFWDFRYALFPKLGSGLGSREQVLAHKQALLRPYVELIGDGSILDVGCGDLEVFMPMRAMNYTGIDVSEQALEIARRKRSDWVFESRSIADYTTSSFDYTSCIDVLIHQPDEVAAEALAGDLVRVARKGIIFSVHTEEIEGAGISFSSSKLRDYIGSLPEVSAVYAIGSYRDVTLYIAEKGAGERNTIHDIGLQELVIGTRFSDEPAILKELVDFSRKKIGFFPRTVIRTHEYPWFAKQMQGCTGKHILDVGAGVCCLPFYLAEQGARVTTVDKYNNLRNDQPVGTWNEWGFLDYSLMDSRIQSFNIDITQFDLGQTYDLIYSVSVIEHMPAHVRRRVIGHLSRLLRPTGRLLLSLDLFPDTDSLWNFNEGRQVDEADHGTLDELKGELLASGLTIHSEDSVRGLPMSRTDVVYLVCDKVRAP